MNTYEIKIKGIVQGVGFRPFVYKLATTLNINGYVKNDEEGVYIFLCCDEKNYENFLEELNLNPPKLSKIDSIKTKKLNLNENFTEFKIIESQNKNNKTTLVSPDISVCDECLEDMFDESNFRYKYPMINCTNCGPRYSIINTVPYDRINTSMKDFTLCNDCKNEYENPLDRRYHAQPIACSKCGPNLTLYDNKNNKISKSNEAINDIVNHIKNGKIVAIKGVGGFHIICDALNEKAINELRIKKQRPHKPFAVMFSNLESIKEHLNLNVKELNIVSNIQKPIVLARKKENSILPKVISPDSNTIGGFIAYTPIHHLIFEKLVNPIIATSANLKGEPIIKELDEVFQKIPNLVDFVLDYNREIINFCDDSVLRIVDDKTLNIRNSRGYAPTVFHLEKKLNKKILALGANQKSNIALAFENSVIVSPYIGDLNSLESIEALKRTIETFKRFYDFKADLIVCDKHPNYESTKLAKKLSVDLNIPLIDVQHHHAHILSTMLEYDLKNEVLGVCFDGTGLGDDGNLWGGEFLVSSKENFKRVAHLNYFKLIGAEQAIKEPRRVALSLLFENFSLEEILSMNNPCIKAFSFFEIKMLHKAWQNNINSPLSSSIGRLFDAVASLSNLNQKQSYEGQTGILVEEKFDENIKESYTFKIEDEIIDINPMIKEILNDRDEVLICSKFLNTLVEIIFTVARKYNLPIVLSGGVFQNKTLLELVIKKLKQNQKEYYFSSKVPLNDGGISLGQIFYAI